MYIYAAVFYLIRFQLGLAWVSRGGGGTSNATTCMMSVLRGIHTRLQAYISETNVVGLRERGGVVCILYDIENVGGPSYTYGHTCTCTCIHIRCSPSQWESWASVLIRIS